MSRFSADFTRGPTPAEAAQIGQRLFESGALNGLSEAQVQQRLQAEALATGADYKDLLASVGDARKGWAGGVKEREQSFRAAEAERIKAANEPKDLPNNPLLAALGKAQTRLDAFYKNVSRSPLGWPGWAKRKEAGDPAQAVSESRAGMRIKASPQALAAAKASEGKARIPNMAPVVAPASGAEPSVSGGGYSEAIGQAEAKAAESAKPKAVTVGEAAQTATPSYGDAPQPKAPFTSGNVRSPSTGRIIGKPAAVALPENE